MVILHEFYFVGLTNAAHINQIPVAEMEIDQHGFPVLARSGAIDHFPNVTVTHQQYFARLMLLADKV